MSWHALILLAFHAVLAPATVVHALIHKRDPRSAFGWIAFCTITPVAGPVLYLFFGVNRSRSRAQRFSLSLLRMGERDRKSTRLNSSHVAISYAVFCLKKKKKNGQVNPLR